jgi:hypothetical protein
MKVLLLNKKYLCVLLLIFFSCQKRYTEITVEAPSCTNSNCVQALIRGKFFCMKQPTINSCWATVLAMLFSWKNQKYISEETILKDDSLAYNVFKKSDRIGITSSQELILYNNLGLKIERQLNPSIQGWMEYLASGPLSITIDANPPYGGTVHAIVLLGLYGENTGLKTNILYADPADGQVHKVDFLEFMKMYEAKYSVDWPIQIIHF